MNFTTLKEQVENILRDIPDARNSDITLTIELWKRYYPNMVITNGVEDWGIELKNLYELPREGVIGRVRRMIQSDKKRTVEMRYLPTSLEVARQRHINEELWHQAMATQQHANN